MNKLSSDSLNQCGLSKKTVASICQVFNNHPNIEQVILYGSRAKGTYKRASDIDLTLQAKTAAYTELMQIESELDDLLLPYQIDLSWYQQIDNPELIEHIKRCGLIFYCVKTNSSLF